MFLIIVMTNFCSLFFRPLFFCVVFILEQRFVFLWIDKTPFDIQFSYSQFVCFFLFCFTCSLPFEFRDVSYNSITEIPAEIVVPLFSLAEFVFSFSFSIPPHVFHSDLCISHNPISSVGFNGITIGSLSSLFVLFHNNLTFLSFFAPETFLS